MTNAERKVVRKVGRAIHLLVEVVEASPARAIMARRITTLVTRKLMRAARAVEVTLDWRDDA